MRVGAAGESSQLMGLLVRGYVSLYTRPNAEGNNTYFLQPASAAYVVEVPAATARLTLLRELTDCPTLDFSTTAIERRYPYSHAGMTSLIMAYNACREPQRASKVVKSTGMRTSIGLKAGGNVSDFKLDPAVRAGKRSQATGYQAGLFLHVATKSRFSAQVEAVYVALRSRYGATDFYNGYATYTTTRQLDIHYAQLQVPVFFRYTAGYHALRPYLNAGASYGLNLANRSTDRYQNSNQPTPDTQKLLPPGSSTIGLAAGAGMLLYYPALPVLSLELRYDQSLVSLGDQISGQSNPARPCAWTLAWPFRSSTSA
ncbi:porin family protein [Hymenobacter cellulosilyticus]|uniref:PorT family protein n=1 Tax=Hymenobacter cellulosilyticus TaxID=2932248 RepID=A0A8T9Q2C1_9BACT|nr:porin family protein [Hymenobacter cellulosilyticus]UOQ71684.1 PorT family protein [Hymenobacter cellulosilyticus]